MSELAAREGVGRLDAEYWRVVDTATIFVDVQLAHVLSRKLAMSSAVAAKMGLFVQSISGSTKRVLVPYYW